MTDIFDSLIRDEIRCRAWRIKEYTKWRKEREAAAQQGTDALLVLIKRREAQLIKALFTHPADADSCLAKRSLKKDQGAETLLRLLKNRPSLPRQGAAEIVARSLERNGVDVTARAVREWLNDKDFLRPIFDQLLATHPRMERRSFYRARIRRWNKHRYGRSSIIQYEDECSN